MTAFKLPDLGEGLQDADLVEWLVKEGEHVQLDQLVLLVETAKAVVELPSPSEGVITRLAVSAGETVKVGQTLFEYEIDQPAARQAIKPNKNTQKSIKRESVSVVGELAKTDDDKSNMFEAVLSTSAERPTEAVTPNQKIDDKKALTRKSNRLIDTNKSKPVCINAFKESKKKTQTNEGRAFNATPAVIAFAKKLGIYEVLKNGSHSELNLQDLIKLYTDKINESASAQKSPKQSQTLKGARKVMAQEMTKAHQFVPAVTLFEDANISHWKTKEDITVRIIDAINIACKKVPLLNALYDSEKMTLQIYESVNLGLAVNSPAGLFVPVIRGADKKTKAQLREEINSYQMLINDRKIQAKDLTGATISLSNFGALSGRYATPIILPPQVCIVGVGKFREAPVVNKGKLEVGKILPISLSFDHRVATGGEAAEFLESLINVLEC